MPDRTVFISYSHEDKDWKDRLVKHLGVLLAGGILDPWDDSRIRAGEDWAKQINEAVDRARVALLLVSAASLTSEYILQREVPRLLQRRGEKLLSVIPVILKPCAWPRIPWLASMQVRPEGKALSQATEPEIDSHLAAIAEEVADTLHPAPRDVPLLTSQPAAFPRPKFPYFGTFTGTPVARVTAPSVTHNVLRNGVYFMDIQVPGSLSVPPGSIAQIVVRFFFQNGPQLVGNPLGTGYRDTGGKVAASTSPIPVIINPYDVGQLLISIPYYALYLQPTWGSTRYNLAAYADIFVNGVVIAQTPWTMFTVRW